MGELLCSETSYNIQQKKKETNTRAQTHNKAPCMSE